MPATAQTTLTDETQTQADDSLERDGFHWWLDFVSMGRAGQTNLGADGAYMGTAADNVTIMRTAQILTHGFQWDNKLLSVHLTNSFLEGAQFELPGMTYPVNGYSFLTSPEVTVMLRPVRMLRLDVDAAYMFAYDVGLEPQDFHIHVVTAAFHVAFEPWERFIGGFPYFDVSAGVKWGLAAGTVDPGTAGSAETDFTTMGLAYGLRLNFNFPVSDEIGLFAGLAYYIEAAHTSDLFNDGGMMEHGNLEWTLAMRWFPQGH